VPDGSSTAKALNYSLNHWEALTHNLRDGDVMLEHRQTLKLLRKVQANAAAADADLKALAGRTQPIVARHLRHAEQMIRL